MVRSRRSLTFAAVTALLMTALAGCAQHDRALAEEKLHGIVQSSARGVANFLEREPAENSAAEIVKTSIAHYDFVTNGIDLSDDTTARALYCLDVDGRVVTLCVFYPLRMNVGGSYLTAQVVRLYGCLEYTGRLGTTQVTARDVECPAELADWANGEWAGEEAEPVLLAEVASDVIEELNNPETPVCQCHSGSPCDCPGG